MQLTEVSYREGQPVESYGPGFFRIAGQVIGGPMLATRHLARLWGGLDDLAPLTALAGEVDVLILGLGAEMRPVPKALAAALTPLGIGIEPMASPVAARVYNVLLAEGRRVALAAVPL